MASGPDRARLTGLTILVVEDEDDSREVMTMFLRHFGALVIATALPAEALTMLQTFTPDIIVADLAMPGMTGTEMLQEIHKRRGKDQRAIPAIAYTAHTPLRDAAREAGFQAYLVKPSEPEDIANEIARLTGRG